MNIGTSKKTKLSYDPPFLGLVVCPEFLQNLYRSPEQLDDIINSIQIGDFDEEYNFSYNEKRTLDEREILRANLPPYIGHFGQNAPADMKIWVLEDGAYRSYEQENTERDSRPETIFKRLERVITENSLEVESNDIILISLGKFYSKKNSSKRELSKKNNGQTISLVTYEFLRTVNQ